MDRGKKKHTCPLVKTARNLPKGQLGAVVFGCKFHTYSECLKKKIFGLPAAHISYVRNIDPGLVLFLFNYSDRKLHGIFRAASCGQMKLDEHAWASCEGADYTPYAAQVKIEIQTKCTPLCEDEFKPVIKDNYYSGQYFWFELDKDQTHGLIKLFLSRLPEKMHRQPKAAKNLDMKSYSGEADMKLKESEVSYASVLANTHGSKKWSDFFTAPSSSSKPSFGGWLAEDESCSLQETSKPPSGDWPLDIESHVHGFDSWEQQALEGEDYFPQVYENEEQFDVLESEGLDLTGGPLQSSVISSDREESKLENLGSMQSDSCDRVIQGNQSNLNASESGLIKMTQEIESLKFNQLKHRLKMDSLEQELVHSKLEINQLMKRCHILESLRLSASDQSIVEECDTSAERVLIVGGFDGHSWLSDLCSYSPLEDQVIPLCPMAFPRLSPSVAKLNGELFIMGGFDDSAWYDTVESYNPMTNEWIQRPSLSKKKGCMAGVSLYETIFVMGGSNGVESLSEVELFDLNIGSWMPTQSMLEKRIGAAAACMNGAIYVAGGFDGNGYVSSVERFDPRQHSWSRVANMKSKRGSHSLVTFNEQLYALGGYDGDSVVLTSEVFDPRLDSWMKKEPMTVSRVNFGSIVHGGKIYAVGGEKGSQVLDVVECYEEGSGWKVVGRATNLGQRSSFSAIVI